MQMIKLFGKIEERENKVFAFIPGLKSEVFPLTHINSLRAADRTHSVQQPGVFCSALAYERLAPMSTARTVPVVGVFVSVRPVGLLP